MKLTKLWASALALLTLASCSQDVDVVQPQEAPRTRQVHIDLTAGQDDNELRVTYGIDANGKTTGLKMSDKNVILRVAVRRGSGAPVMQSLEFVKAPDRNYATYSGQITIPAGGTGSYSIAAVLLKEAGTDGKVYGTEGMTDQAFAFRPSAQRDAIVAFARTNLISANASEVEANIPYITEWQPLTINAAGAAERVTLQLRPFGTLLRMRIKNESAQAQVFRAVQFVTEAFSPGVSFDFSFSARGSYPWWSGENTEVYTINLGDIRVEGKTSGEAQYSPWLYAVAYPRKVSAGITTVATLRTTTGPYLKAFATTDILPHGSVPLTLVYTGESDANFEDLIDRDEWTGSTTRPKLAIEYVAEYSFAKDKTSLVSDHLSDNANIGRFSFEEATQLTTPVEIGGVRYSTPTNGEMLSIFPGRFDPVSGRLNHNGNVTLTNFLERDVTIGSETRNFVSDYKNTDGGSFYGLRFKYTKHCTAYRYRTITTSGANKALVVDCIYIGGAAYDIADIAQDSFWDARAGQIVSRTFPFYGAMYDAAGALEGGNTAGLYWTSASLEDTGKYVGTIHSVAWAAVVFKSELSLLPIRPWIRD